MAEMQVRRRTPPLEWPGDLVLARRLWWAARRQDIAPDYAMRLTKRVLKSGRQSIQHSLDVMAQRGIDLRHSKYDPPAWTFALECSAQLLALFDRSTRR